MLCCTHDQQTELRDSALRVVILISRCDSAHFIKQSYKQMSNPVNNEIDNVAKKVSKQGNRRFVGRKTPISLNYYRRFCSTHAGSQLPSNLTGQINEGRKSNGPPYALSLLSN